MNIFYLDHDPVVAAQAMVDRHVVKMILESAQLLSTAHRVLDGEQTVERRAAKRANVSDPERFRNIKRWKLFDNREAVVYAATHSNHPSAVWVRESVENYSWLVEHFFALMNEYTHRYNKKHLCGAGDLAYMLSSPPHNLKNYDWTPIPSAMDDKYIISDDPVVNYRNYYKFGKADLHKWTNRNPPSWI